MPPSEGRASTTQRRQGQQASQAWVGPEALGTIVAAYLVAVSACAYFRIYHTPPVQPASAAPALFSEERARAHIVALASEIGDRQVSHPGLQRAAAYLENELNKIKDLGASRRDVSIEESDQRCNLLAFLPAPHKVLLFAFAGCQGANLRGRCYDLHAYQLHKCIQVSTTCMECGPFLLDYIATADSSGLHARWHVGHWTTWRW